MQALDATNGSLIWEYRRPAGGLSRAKSLGIFEDLILFAAPDSFIVALEARTGRVRWETKSSGTLTSGTTVFGDKVVSGRGCSANGRVDCYIVAHDAKTGKEVWRFYTAAGSDDPVGDASWGGAPEAARAASSWGLGGSYDPVRKMTYWGVANPTPYTRASRHAGNIEAIPKTGERRRRHCLEDIYLRHEHLHNCAGSFERMNCPEEIAGGEILFNFLELMQELLEPQLIGLMDDDEEHLVVLCRR